ncbi:MAG TPA: hypothetical protein VNT75_06750 [Symbiobacteriaceae bacterium]|nr:hypothetical protein [Symbiobacteriaceae bacterium]
MRDMTGRPGEQRPLAGFRELVTPAWRVWYGSLHSQGEHLVYITASPECLAELTALVPEIAAEHASLSLIYVRIARDEAALARINSQPDWAGKAVTFALNSAEAAQALAHTADVILAGRKLQGPPAMRARPQGGRSGMVFLRRSGAGQETQTEARRDRLSALLGGSGN